MKLEPTFGPSSSMHSLSNQWIILLLKIVRFCVDPGLVREIHGYLFKLTLPLGHLNLVSEQPFNCLTVENRPVLC